MGNLAVLEALATPATKPQAKGKTPEVSAPDYMAKARRWSDVNRQLKDLEAEKKQLTAELGPLADAQRVGISRQRGEMLSSVKWNGVTWVVQARFSEIKDPETFNAAQKLEADAKVAVGSYFKTMYTMEADPTQLPGELLTAMAQAGVKFSKVMRPTAAYLADMTLKPDVAALAAALPTVKPVSFFRD